LSLTEELITATLTAPDDLKEKALKVLRSVPSSSIPGDPEPYMTLAQISKRIGVSTCSLWRWKVPGHELGGRRRFRLSEVLAYLESDELKARAEDLKTERKLRYQKTRFSPDA
jgi:hypothetical protein